MTATQSEFTWISKLSYDKYYDNFTKNVISLLVGLWELLFRIGILVSRLKLSRDSVFSSKIETIPPNSRRLDTLQGILGVPGHASPEKIRNLRSSNCWKYIEIVNLTITVLFLYPPLPTGLFSYFAWLQYQPLGLTLNFPVLFTLLSWYTPFVEVRSASGIWLQELGGSETHWKYFDHYHQLLFQSYKLSTNN